MDYKKCIKEYVPRNLEEEATRSAIQAFITVHGDNVLTRENVIAHMTASSVIINEAHTKMLMIHHKIYNTWTWQGGHADGEEDMLRIALKEAEEETGLTIFKILKINNKPITTLDILPVYGHIKKGAHVSTHLHLNVAFIFEANEADMLLVNKEETNGLKWVPFEEIDDYAKEPEITPIYHKLIQAVNMSN